MKVTIEIDDEELKRRVTDQIADKCVSMIWEGDSNLPWAEREEDGKRRRDAIMSKINWKVAADQLGEVVVKKFFSNMLERK